MVWYISIMKKIALTKGFYAIVDDGVFDKLSKFNWHYSVGYACRDVWKKGKNKRLMMHRLIIGAKQGEEVDHKNGDRLDNRGDNLRFCTRSQNNFNQQISSRNKSGYKGVSWDKGNKKWRSQAHINDKAFNLGRYDTKKEAALAYNNFAIKHFGEFARLNLI